MRSNEQAIVSPLGITVYGSAIARVEPDIASLHIAVSRVDKNPQRAFQEVRTTVKAVRAFLTRAGVSDVGFSQARLEHAYEYSPRKIIGYQAKVDIHLLLQSLDDMEDVLSGAIDAGANEVAFIAFQTSDLKAAREQVRRKAVEAAHRKAVVYCEAAHVALGNVLHIEDVNPDTVRGRGEGMHVVVEAPTLDEEEVHAFNPAAIVVAGAVRIAYAIQAEQ